MITCDTKGVNVPVHGKTMSSTYYFCLATALTMMLSMAFVTVQDAEAQKYQHRATVVDADGRILDEHDDREAIHPDDSLALVAFYHSTNGDHWVNNAGWLEDRVDFWVGIDRVQNVGTVDNPEWRVTRIDLPSRNINRPGPIPPEFKNMEYLDRFSSNLNYISGNLENFEGLNRLERIEMRSNLLSGEIPWQLLSELESLERLGIRNVPKDPGENVFVGQIDPVVGQFPRLERIEVTFSYIDGPIPQEIANVQSLQRIRLNSNKLTGEWPDLSGLPELERIQFYENPFDPGPVPEWLDGMDNLDVLEFWATNRTGTLPSWINQYQEMSSLGFGEGIWRDEGAPHPDWQAENMLGGEIPDLTIMPTLSVLRIYGPGFTGPIPEWLADIPSLQQIYLIDTGYEGDIPGSLFTLDEFTRVYIINNRNLTGGLPIQMQGATALERIHIEFNSNMSVGQLQPWIGNLTSARELHLSGVGVTGPLPDEMQNMTSLEHLTIGDNPGITGPIPAWVQDLPLVRFEIDRTSMDVDEIPAWLAGMSGLERLGLSGLGLTGTIPEWLGDFDFLHHLNLNDNNLTGPIPASLGNLITMDSISLANNNLEGTLPDELANMGRLTDDLIGLNAFSVAGNPGLTGPIPMGFTHGSMLHIFEYEDTGLCEPVDQAFHDWLESVPENSYEFFPPKLSRVSRTNVSCEPLNADNPDVPNRLALHQNYPNPFNPSTTIAYEIPSDVHVTLNVYNVIGQRVATLVNEVRPAGSYEVNFDAARLASGTYIYRLQAGDRSLTQTMMLMK